MITKTSSDNSSSIKVRIASDSDLDFLLALEKESFPKHRQSTKKSISNSIQSSKQLVLVAEVQHGYDDIQLVGSAVIFLYKRSIRIYSIAVSSNFRGMGVGESLMKYLIEFATNQACEKIILEADNANSSLVNWYRKYNFEITKVLKDYYRENEHAYSMTRRLDNHTPGEGVVLVVDDDVKKHIDIADIPTFSAREYLSDIRFSRSNRYHILNCCNSYKTHSMGYYVSLLAAARNHRITPSVMTVKDSANQSIAQSLLDEIKDFLEESLKNVKEGYFDLTVIMGRTEKKRYSGLGKKLFSLFEIPFFSLHLEKNGTWRMKKITILNIRKVLELWPDILKESLLEYQKKKRYRKTKLRNFKYDLAILINNNEKTPPSCPVALKKFREAAERVGFSVEFITKADKSRICEFDALFIRETTALNNHTYSLARHAYTEGLVVIDDPWSILLCSNKVYLYERLANEGVRQPNGWLLTRKNSKKSFLESLSYPLVLKLPESSFSMGVFRVENAKELATKIKEMFVKSDLVIAQEFLASDYDWRIGLLDNSPIFACKYYMANGHWQIYNWQSNEQDDFSGNHETVPINQVPAHILKAACKAASLIGNGLYGVDLKEINGKAYVIEVNDNPNIDAGIEDEILGDELYIRIMNSIFNRIEAERQQIRYLI